MNFVGLMRLTAFLILIEFENYNMPDEAIHFSSFDSLV